MNDICPSISLDLMRLNDIPQVHTLEVQCFPAPWDISAYYQEMQNPNSYYLVAHVDERVVGFGGMWVVAGEGHIVTLAVHAAFRRRGIGRRLMDGLLAEARRRGALVVTLEVRVTNTPAQLLYTSYGFRIIAYRKNYYPDNHEDAAVMSLTLRDRQ